MTTYRNYSNIFAMLEQGILPWSTTNFKDLLLNQCKVSLSGVRGIGIDIFEDSFLRFKLYSGLNQFPSDQDILTLTNSEQVQKAISSTKDLWDSEKESSLCFGYKSSKEIEGSYVHVKFKNGCSYKFMDRIDNLPSPVLFKYIESVMASYHGVSIETSKPWFGETQKIRSKYYSYIRDPKFFKAALSLWDKHNRCSGKYDLNQIEEIETYFDNKYTYKWNIIYKMDKDFNIQADVYSSLSVKEKELVLEFEKVTGLKAVYTGSTDSQVTSAYFSLTNKLDNVFGI